MICILCCHEIEKVGDEGKHDKRDEEKKNLRRCRGFHTIYQSHVQFSFVGQLAFLQTDEPTAPPSGIIQFKPSIHSYPDPPHVSLQADIFVVGVGVNDGIGDGDGDGDGVMVGDGVDVAVGRGVGLIVGVGVTVDVGLVEQVMAIGGENWEKKLRSLQSLQVAHAYWT